MSKLKERFLRYIKFDTQSDPRSESYPSTAKQLELSRHLVEEMKEMGLSDVEIDKFGYVTGTVPASEGYEDKPVIGFISHVDTSPDISGANVNPQIIENYDGKDIKLNPELTMSIADFPELELFKGHTIITTDGTTLLGADNKAGIAEILTAAERLLNNPEIKHGKIRIAFTPDEEIGKGVDHFDVEKFGANFGYTIDGGFAGELEYENFNAAAAKIEIQGRNIHPGYAKDKMLNATLVAQEFNSLLPANQRPEHTEHYDGFYLLINLNGTVDTAEMEYIIRDHSREKFEQMKQYMESIAAFLNEKYSEFGEPIKLTLTDQYYNMREMVEPHPEVIEKAKQAIIAAGVEPIIKPIRGGTDGSRLSYMGLPCPNIFTGGMNFHGRYEYCSLDTMEKSVQTIVNLAQLWGK